MLDVRASGGPDAAEFKRRFSLEAAQLAKIVHPNVATIFEHGDAPEGCFVAMEYLEGRSLADEIARRGRLAPARAVHVALQMARGLLEAHALGVLHRDLAAENVFLVQKDGDADFVKLVDFALVQDEKTGDAQEPPGAEPITGSPRYMAPEQVQGKEVDARADVYSLGVVFYAMLTGRPPFERRTELATMMAQVSDPPPPMKTVMEGLEVAPELEAIVMRCLAKNPDDRWASMDDLLEVLAQATPSSAAPRAAGSAPAARTSRGGARLALLVGVLAAAAGLVALAFHERSEPPVGPEASRPVPTVTVHVESDPPGARVTENGETLCAATPCDVPFTAEGADPSTQHHLRLDLPGYRVEEPIVTPASGPLHLTLTKSVP